MKTEKEILRKNQKETLEINDSVMDITNVFPGSPVDWTQPRQKTVSLRIGQ